MFGLRYEKKGAYLFLLFLFINAMIHGTAYLAAKIILPFYIGMMINFLIIYLFSMYYHKRLNIKFTKPEMKNISFTFQSIAALAVFFLAFVNPLLDMTLIISLIIYLVFNYFLFYLFLWLYKKLNKLA